MKVIQAVALAAVWLASPAFAQDSKPGMMEPKRPVNAPDAPPTEAMDDDSGATGIPPPAQDQAAQAQAGAGAEAMVADKEGNAIGKAGDARAKEDRKHTIRLAKIARLEELSKGEGKADLAARATQLRALELKRHTRALARIEKQGAKGRSDGEHGKSGEAKGKMAGDEHGKAGGMHGKSAEEHGKKDTVGKAGDERGKKANRAMNDAGTRGKKPAGKAPQGKRGDQ